MMEALLTSSADEVVDDLSQTSLRQSNSARSGTPDSTDGSFNVNQRVLFSQIRKDTVWSTVVSIVFLATLGTRVALSAMNTLQEVELSEETGSTFFDFGRYEFKIAMGDDDGCKLQQTAFQKSHNGHAIRWNCTRHSPTDDKNFSQTSQCVCKLSQNTTNCKQVKMNIDDDDYLAQMYAKGSILDATTTSLHGCKVLTEHETLGVLMILVRSPDRPQIYERCIHLVGKRSTTWGAKCFLKVLEICSTEGRRRPTTLQCICESNHHVSAGVGDLCLWRENMAIETRAF